MKFVFPVTFPVTFLSQGIYTCGTHSRAWYVFVLVRPQPHFEDRTAINIGSDYNPDTSVGSRSIPRSDRSKISYFPRFVGRVQSQGFSGQSLFSSCIETELGIRFPIPTGFGSHVGRVGSQVKPGLDPTGIHYWMLLFTNLVL